jgi:hypothetical protein
MADRRVFAAGAAAGLVAAGTVWLGSALWARWSAPQPPKIEAVSTYRQPDAAAAPSPALAAPTPAKPAPRDVPEPEPAPAPPSGSAARLELPVFDKLVAAPLSREPHQVLGAWDEDRDSARPGDRRAFVLAVSPSQSDSSLEALARDIRAQNLDAKILEVRIYDDAAAAIAPRLLDSGQAARAHLVAEVQRNPAAGLDVVRVRGRELPP